MNVVVVCNHDEDHLGVLEEVLSDLVSNLTFVYRDVSSNLERLDKVDLVLSMGSTWSVYWPAMRSEIRFEQDFLLSQVARGVPIFGICFGAQILSSSLLGKVARCSSPEFGWVEIDSTIAEHDFSGPWMQWHQDCFSLPPGGELLATSMAGPQIFRHGRNIGTQFHPEITKSILEKWVKNGGQNELATYGMELEGLFEFPDSKFELSRANCKLLFNWFLEHIAYSTERNKSITSAQSSYFSGCNKP